MKKQFTLLMKQSIIVSLFVMSALLTNAQSKHQTPSTKKNADRHLQTNQAEGFLPFEKQTNDAILFKTPNPLLNPKSLIQLYDSIYGYRWDTITNGWENQVNWKMINYVYDANHNLTSYLSQHWSGSAWVNNSLNTFTYDANNFEQSYAHKYWNNTGTKISHGDSTYQCFHTVMGINSLEKNLQSVQLFPNPATNKITISKTADLQKETIVSIYNIQGEMVITNTFYYQNTMEMDVSLLAKGVYIVKIQSEKGVGSRKLVIQ